MAPATAGRSGVRVMVRVRPLSESEKKRSAEYCLEAKGTTVTALDPDMDFSEKAAFQFDDVLWSIPADECPSDLPPADQAEVYARAGRPVLDEALDGYNTCLLAYGQTGSGKTYSMLGAPRPEHRGVIPRLCADLFDRIADGAEASASTSKHTVELCFMELYNERVRDLLTQPEKGPKTFKDRWAKEYDGQPTELKVRQHPLTGPYVEGLTRATVTSTAECMSLIARGGKERTVADTAMNAESSRSHALLQLTVTRTEALGEVVKGRKKAVNNVRMSRLNLVDLAGSERVEKTRAQGQRLTEAASINKSLTTLRMVIDTLIDNGRGRGKQRVPPYRESLLTWILADCFGGNACLRLLAAVSPHPYNCEETVSTLRYAQRARGIVNRARVNEDASAKLIRELNAKVKVLEDQLLQGRRRGTLPAERMAYLEEEVKMQRLAREELQRQDAEVAAKLGGQTAEAEGWRREREELRSRGNDLARETQMWRERAERAESALGRGSGPQPAADGWPPSAAVLVSALTSFVLGSRKQGEAAAAVYATAEGLLSVLTAADGSDSGDDPPAPDGEVAAFGSCLVDSAAFFPGANPTDQGAAPAVVPDEDGEGRPPPCAAGTDQTDPMMRSSLVEEGEAEREPQREYVSHLRRKLSELQVAAAKAGNDEAPTGGAGGLHDEGELREKCDECGRSFRPDVLARHVKHCARNQQKRAVFDTSSQRAKLADGTDASKFAKPAQGAVSRRSKK